MLWVASVRGAEEIVLQADIRRELDWSTQFPRPQKRSQRPLTPGPIPDRARARSEVEYPSHRQLPRGILEYRDEDLHQDTPRFRVSEETPFGIRASRARFGSVTVSWSQSVTARLRLR
jgi:hypothetical protein